MSRVHLIDWQWSVSTNDIATTSLLSHSVSHEERLVGLLRTKPTIGNKIKW